MNKDRKEIVIVGAGIIGVCTAYYLTRHPDFDPKVHHITIIEARRPAGGASGKAGGLLALWAFPQQIVPLSFKLHQELADEYDGAAEWGYRRLATVSVEGNITASNLKSVNNAARRPASSPLKLPEELDWIKTGIIDGWSSLGGKETSAQVHPFKFTTYILKKVLETGAVDLIIGKVTQIHTDSEGAATAVSYSTSTTSHQLHSRKNNGHHHHHHHHHHQQQNPSNSDTNSNEISDDQYVTEGPSHEEYDIKSTPSLTSSDTGSEISSILTDDSSNDSTASSLEDELVESAATTPNRGPASPENHADPQQDASSNEQFSSRTTVYLPADQIVLTLGPWTSKLLPSCPISGLRAHSITILPTKQVSPYALFTELRVSRGRYVSPEIYPRKDEVYVCGEGDTLADVPESTDDVEVIRERCDELFTYAGEVSSQLKNGRILKRQACYLPVVDVPSCSGPFIGETNVEKLFLASGHSCWGINNAPATGKLMAEILLEGGAHSASLEGLEPEFFFDATPNPSST